MMNKEQRKAYVFMDGYGQVCFSIGELSIEFFASSMLTKILGVLHWDNTGYIVIDTNYGEEFFDIKETLEELGLDKRYNVEKLMSSIKEWEVKEVNSMKTVKTRGNSAKIREDAFMIIGNIAFLSKLDKNGNRILVTVDLNNTDYKASFYYDESIRRYNQISSTFKEGKRKYEMLYLLERNTEFMQREIKRCQNIQMKE